MLLINCKSASDSTPIFSSSTISSFGTMFLSFNDSNVVPQSSNAFTCDCKLVVNDSFVLSVVELNSSNNPIEDIIESLVEFNVSL